MEVPAGWWQNVQIPFAEGYKGQLGALMNNDHDVTKMLVNGTAAGGAASATMTTLYGDTISTMILGGPGGLTPHTWVADANGLFHTTADLSAEWHQYYKTMLDGHGAQLTAIQRLEGNAEAVFENTSIATRSATDQKRYREDVQRQYDAMAAAMKINATTLNIDPNAPLTTTTYLELERTLQSNATLLELAIQGHGLNGPPSSRYRGYTQDFQNNVDKTTLYVGGGLDNNQNALTAFFDDVVLTHVPFATVWSNGHLEQLNQNGNKEDTLDNAVTALDDAMYFRVYQKTDFSQTASTANNAYVSKAAAIIHQNGEPAAHQITTLYGEHIADTITNTPHTWTADTNGLFHTTTDLAAEWKQYYQMMQAGQGGQLTAIQRLEGNAEAVFENTALANLSPAKLARDREDAQRQFDAMGAAMAINQKLYGIDPKAALTEHSYLLLQRTLHSNAALEELAIQGHGLNSPPSARYRGYTNDFQNNVDNTTNYVGGGLDNNQNALTNFFDDIVLGHTPFPTVWHNGSFVQLNQNGNREDTLVDSLRATNDAMFDRVFKPTDFKKA